MHTSLLDWNLNINEIYNKTLIKQYKDCYTYKAKWRHEDVFIKMVKNSDEVDNELEILSKCIHPKICQFLGAYKDEEYTSIIFEYMDHGDLHNFIQFHPLSKEEKVNLMIDIVIGLNYLFKRKPKTIIHRDLKPSNIMINKYNQPKISDFGVSKLLSSDDLEEYINHTGETGTYMWMAPEIMKHEPYNYKSDIYSFGLIMYYIWEEKLPYTGNNIQIAFAKVNNTINNLIIDNCELSELINDCIKHEKTQRPNTEEIINRLQKIKLHSHPI